MESWANDLLFLPEVLEVDILAALGSEDWSDAIHAGVVSGGPPRPCLFPFFRVVVFSNGPTHGVKAWKRALHGDRGWRLSLSLQFMWLLIPVAEDSAKRVCDDEQWF